MDQDNQALQNNQSAEQTTQQKIDALTTYMSEHGVNAASLAELRSLQAQLLQEQQAIQRDNQAITTDKLEIQLAQQKNPDPLALAYMVLGKVAFSMKNGQPVITVNGQEINPGANPALAQAVVSKDPDAIMRALMAGNFITFGDNINNLITGTQYARRRSRSQRR